MSAPETASPAAPARPAVARPAPATAAGARIPGPGGSWLASQGRLPLAFLGLGLAWFAVATALTAWAPELLATAHIAPGVVALVHAWVLGFFVTVAVGAMYQLAPVALGTTLWSERSGWWHLALHGLAVPVMIYGFWHWQLAWVGAAALAVLAGVAVFSVNSWATIFRSGKRDAVAWSLALATAWLLLTVLAGLTLVANRLWAFWSADALALLRGHAHLGLVGFFLTLLQGVTFRLVPMFTLAEVPDWRPVRAGLWLSQLGLVVLAPALAYHGGWLSFGAGGAIALGMALSAYALRRTLATRKKRLLDPGVRALARGGVLLAIAAGLGLWLAAPTTRAGSLPGGPSANVYGTLVLLGGLLPAISGMMNKIVPFLTWMRAYGPRVGRAPTPPATALARPKLESAALLVQAVATAALILGSWTLHAPTLRFGGLLLAVSTALYVANLGIVLRHLWHPQPVSAPLAVFPHP